VVVTVTLVVPRLRWLVVVQVITLPLPLRWLRRTLRSWILRCWLDYPVVLVVVAFIWITHTVTFGYHVTHGCYLPGYWLHTVGCVTVTALPDSRIYGSFAWLLFPSLRLHPVPGCVVVYVWFYVTLFVDLRLRLRLTLRLFVTLTPCCYVVRLRSRLYVCYVALLTFVVAHVVYVALYVVCYVTLRYVVDLLYVVALRLRYRLLLVVLLLFYTHGFTLQLFVALDYGFTDCCYLRWLPTRLPPRTVTVVYVVTFLDVLRITCTFTFGCRLLRLRCVVCYCGCGFDCGYVAGLRLRCFAFTLVVACRSPRCRLRCCSVVTFTLRCCRCYVGYVVVALLHVYVVG